MWGKQEESVAWVLHQTGVSAAIVEARQPVQIQQLAAASELILSPEIIQKLNSATEHIKRSLGPNPDMWMSNGRFR